MSGGGSGASGVTKPRAQWRAASVKGRDMSMSPVLYVYLVATADHEPDEPDRVGERTRTEAGMNLSRHRRTRYRMRPACTTPKMMPMAIRGSTRLGSRSPLLVAAYEYLTVAVGQSIVRAKFPHMVAFSLWRMLSQ